MRHLDDRDTAGAQHAGDLGHRGGVVRHVLEHVVADHQVDGVVRQRELRDARAEVDDAAVRGGVEVEGDVAIAAELAQPRRRGGAGGDVEQRAAGERARRDQLDEQREETVAL